MTHTKALFPCCCITEKVVQQRNCNGEFREKVASIGIEQELVLRNFRSGVDCSGLRSGEWIGYVGICV